MFVFVPVFVPIDGQASHSMYRTRPYPGAHCPQSGPVYLIAKQGPINQLRDPQYLRDDRLPQQAFSRGASSANRCFRPVAPHIP